MWDRKETDKQRVQQPPAPGRSDSKSVPQSNAPASSGTTGRANIGGSLFIKGEVTGSEDLTVEGKVEGKIHLQDHNLSIAQSGRVTADVHAKTVTIHGEVKGNVTADQKIDISETGRVTGDLFAPRVAVSDGAEFRGSVEMGSASGNKSSKVDVTRKRPAQVAAGVQVAAQGKMAN
jgi:cytoskeletal protein CcmA (bactofilin family)